MQQINQLLSLLDDLEQSASSEGCEGGLMVVSASALCDVRQAAKLIKADLQSRNTEQESQPATEPIFLTVERFKQISERLLAKHYGLQLNDTALENEIIVQECMRLGYRPYQAVAEIAEEADLERVDVQGPFGVPSKAAITAADEDAVLILNSRYAESIIGDRASVYDALEIHGVRDYHEPGDPQGTCCEIDDENPQFFSVYVHLKPSDGAGGVECVGDFEAHHLAQQYAKELSEKYGWPIHDFVGPNSKLPLAA